MNILLTGGRAPVTLELARLLSRAGDQVFVGDSIRGHLCRLAKGVRSVSYAAPAGPDGSPSEFVRDIVEIIERHGIELVIPTCEEIFYLAQARETIEQYCPIFCGDAGTMDRLHNKFSFAEYVRQLGWPVPATHRLCESDDPAAILQEVEQWYSDEGEIPFALKPAYTRFGADVCLFPRGIGDSVDRKRLAEIVGNESFGSKAPWLLQQFVFGQHFCSFGIARGGKMLACATYPVTFRAGHSAVLFESVRHRPIEQWTEDFVRKSNCHGFIAFDFVVDDQTVVWPLECNPRLTSGIHLLAGEPNLRDVIVHAATPSNDPQADEPIYADSSPCSIKAALCLYGLGQAGISGRFWKWAKISLLSKDVIFRWSDPLPALGQFATLFAFWRIARRNRISLTEATTFDIEYSPGEGENEPQRHEGVKEVRK